MRGGGWDQSVRAIDDGASQRVWCTVLDRSYVFFFLRFSKATLRLCSIQRADSSFVDVHAWAAVGVHDRSSMYTFPPIVVRVVCGLVLCRCLVTTETVLHASRKSKKQKPNHLFFRKESAR